MSEEKVDRTPRQCPCEVHPRMADVWISMPKRRRLGAKRFKTRRAAIAAQRRLRERAKRRRR